MPISCSIFEIEASFFFDLRCVREGMGNLVFSDMTTTRYIVVECETDRRYSCSKRSQLLQLLVLLYLCW